MNATTRANTSSVRAARVTGLVLLIPLIGKTFTDDWEWTLGDFVVMGALLFITAYAFDWVMKNIGRKYRIVAGAAIIGVFLLIWAQLAVGLVVKLFTGEILR